MTGGAGEGEEGESFWGYRKWTENETETKMRRIKEEEIEREERLNLVKHSKNNFGAI